MHEIFKANGKVVPSLATRTGHRKHVDHRQTADLNEAIVQPVKYKKFNLHGDAIMAAEEKKDSIQLLFDDPTCDPEADDNM